MKSKVKILLSVCVVMFCTVSCYDDNTDYADTQTRISI